MTIAVTGATGFLGRNVVRRLVRSGHRCRCWYRPDSDRSGFDDLADGIEWTRGALDRPDEFDAFCRGADAVVHSALHRAQGAGFRAAAADHHLDGFLRANLMGSLALMTAARRCSVPRFVFISTCAVHEIILDDRPLDEAHPLWATSHYGAHKAAIEQFVHSFGLGEGWPICALRPTGIYGRAHPVASSRWYGIVRDVVRGRGFTSDRGGKEVHVADVARAVEVLLQAPAETIAGQAYNCYDLYVAERTVAQMARDLSRSTAAVGGENRGPKHQIDTSRLRALGMTFGGEALLRRTVEELVEAARAES